ncbi:NAD(P)H-hydrate dehydratase [Melghirimyces algeriensis]|uniref:Bifunctional NAD(P)H-hydrate repair enzyme n=1 Tax=Melghirimyces algeriensis TaxID=910412 RepID=A0A521EYH4_9BACL|nr:NAD(P)H-hydrate dehydratase [Melghirimyces algeriensis]SMO88959.1 NAD(P)H-hydrate epimerase [Melghirimyces algeriensis]
MVLCTAQEARDLDRYTIEVLGMPGAALMENAGQNATRMLLKRFSEAKRAVVLSGTGNNGGDGFVVARSLFSAGWKVSVWVSGQVEKMSLETRAFYQVCRNMGLAVSFFDGDRKEELLTDLQKADVVVDALLGTGVRGALREPVRCMVQMVNEAEPGFVLALDAPTGVDTDTGAILGEAIQADLTVSFATWKWCHYLLPASEFCGEVRVVDIGMPEEAIHHQPPQTWVNDPSLWHDHLTPRSPWSHKGTYGHLLVLGGSKGMLGAAYLSGMAALKSGVGMVTIGVPHGQEASMATKVTEALVWGWPDEGSGLFIGDFPSDWEERFSRFHVVTAGPGLGRFSGEKAWLERLLHCTDGPLVLDADALNILSSDLSMLQFRKKPTILTPHPGEMARLIGGTVKDVEASRHRVAKELAEKTGATIVLKGSFTVIAFPDGRQVLNGTASPALAKAGSGDVLTGVLGAFLAQGIPVESAAPMAVYLHGMAGRLAVRSSDYSVLASEVIDNLGNAIHQTL